MNNKARTFEATMANLARSRNNEEKLEQQLSVDKKLTTPQLVKKLKWTINQTNSTLYRLRSKGAIRYTRSIDNRGKVIKEIYLVPHTEFMR